MHVTLGVESGPHGDHVGMNIEDVSNDLRRSCFVSLPLRARTHGDHHLAVDVQLAIGPLGVPGKRRMRVYNLRLTKIICSGIERGANANPDEPSFVAGGAGSFFFFLPPPPPMRSFATCNIFG